MPADLFCRMTHHFDLALIFDSTLFNVCSLNFISTKSFHISTRKASVPVVRGYHAFDAFVSFHKEDLKDVLLVRGWYISSMTLPYLPSLSMSLIYSSFVSRIGDPCAYFLLLRPHCRKTRSMKCATCISYSLGIALTQLHFRFIAFSAASLRRTYTFRQTQIVQIEILRPQQNAAHWVPGLGLYTSCFQFVDIFAC